MGGKSSNTQSTVTQQNIPEEFYPYFERLLIRGEEESLQPYTPYEGQRLAGQTGDTEASYDVIRDVATRDMPGRDLATNVAAQNITMGGQLLGANQPFQFTPFTGFNAGQATPFSASRPRVPRPIPGSSASRLTPTPTSRRRSFRSSASTPPR